MANLGHTVGNARFCAAYTPFGSDKEPTGVDMTGTSAIANAFVNLVRNGVLVARSRANASGVWHFYDMDDSSGQVYSIASFTQAGVTGEAWNATVVGAVATVAKVANAIRSNGSVSSG